MDAKKRKRLEAAGWTVGTAATFLNLSDAEATLVDMLLKRRRKGQVTSQPHRDNQEDQPCRLT